jgi:BirA family transcriptional regulator, biotin operon repressor / biotin---[acetyl-CoA-carboxylase] ligase
MRGPVEPGESGVIGSQVLQVEESSSTNDLAIQMAEEGFPEGWVVTAERQTQGRGKQGRNWESPSGGLWTSVILRPPNPASDAPIFTLMGAVASAEVIRGICGLQAFVRWPNDLYLGGRKMGGILCEVRGTEREIRYLVMGIGINVNQEEKDFSPSLRGRATSLFLESGRSWDREALADSLYNRLDWWYRIVRLRDMSPLLLRLEEVCEGPDKGWGLLNLRQTMRSA